MHVELQIDPSIAVGIRIKHMHGRLLIMAPMIAEAWSCLSGLAPNELAYVTHSIISSLGQTETLVVDVFPMELGQGYCEQNHRLVDLLTALDRRRIS